MATVHVFLFFFSNTFSLRKDQPLVTLFPFWLILRTNAKEKISLNSIVNKIAQVRKSYGTEQKKKEV